MPPIPTPVHISGLAKTNMLAGSSPNELDNDDLSRTNLSMVLTYKRSIPGGGGTSPSELVQDMPSKFNE